MKRLIFVFLLLALPVLAQESQPSATWTQEPDGYRGCPLGASEKDTKKCLKVPTPIFIMPGSINWVCRGKKNKLKTCETNKLPIGDKTILSRFMFDVDKFIAVSFNFDAEDYDYFKTVFATKYGEPTGSKSAPVQNRMGAQYQNQMLTWEGTRILVELTKYGSTLDEGSAFIGLRSYIERIKKESDESAKKAADDI